MARSLHPSGVLGRVLRALLKALVLLVLTILVAIVLLRVVQPPLTTLQAIRLVEGYGFARDLVAFEALGPHLPRAVIAAEDNFFCEHHGVDWDAFQDQVARFLQGERPRGASTITMQLTKNLFLWPDRSGPRKALELALAPAVDLVLPKRRQLAIYLNQVEFGAGLYGAEAAARHYYGKPARELTVNEAARLAALLPGPLARTPGEVGESARRIERRLGQLGPLLACAG